MTPRALRDAVRRHVLAGVIRELGSRVLQVGQPQPTDALPHAREGLTVRVLSRATEGCAVGVPEHLPVQSGAFTGVLLATTSPLDELAPALRETHRALQPGGRLVMMTTLAGGGDAKPLEDVVGSTGLALCDLLPVRPVGEASEGSRLPPVLAVRVEARCARQALGDGEAAEVVVVAVRPGGMLSGLAELPDVRQSIASMFIPPAWTRKRRRGR